MEYVAAVNKRKPGVAALPAYKHSERRELGMSR
jgi:hypothetical protein